MPLQLFTPTEKMLSGVNRSHYCFLSAVLNIEVSASFALFCSELKLITCFFRCIQNIEQILLNPANW